MKWTRFSPSYSKGKSNNSVVFKQLTANHQPIDKSVRFTIHCCAAFETESLFSLVLSIFLWSKKLLKNYKPLFSKTPTAHFYDDNDQSHLHSEMHFSCFIEFNSALIKFPRPGQGQLTQLSCYEFCSGNQCNICSCTIENKVRIVKIYSDPKRKHTKRLLAKIYYSPQSKIIISLRLV